MRTLLYKRTHTSDPDKKGWFGIKGCMGHLRPLPFDAVIGIGGISRGPAAIGIGRKVNWIGIGAKKRSVGSTKSPIVTFEHFALFEEPGLEFWAIALTLASRMYSRFAPRFLFDDEFSKAERAGIARVLKLAANAPPSNPLSRSVGPSCPGRSRVPPKIVC